MSANTNPLFPLTPNVQSSLVTTACTDRTGATTTNLVLAYTPGGSGDFLNWIHFEATGNTAAACMLIFLKAGSTYSLVGQTTVSAVSASTTVASWEGDWTPAHPLALPSGTTVYVATTVTQNIVCTAVGGSY